MEDSDLIQKFSEVETNDLPDFYSYDKPLEKGLWVLLVSKDKLNIKKMTSKQIISVIENVKEMDADGNAIARAFARAENKIKVHKENGEVFYEILKPGRDFIKNSLVNADSTDENEKIYPKNSRYDFYSDIKQIFSVTNNELLIVDSYMNDDVFDTYITNLPKDILTNLNIRILTNPNTPKGNFRTVVNMFKSQHSKFEVRESDDCHDRALFADSHAWVFGQALKAAGNKPTYLIKIKRSQEFKKIFESIWVISKKIV